MTNTVILKRSSVANSVPGPGNLVAGELAINYTDGNLFYKNNNNVITVIASNKFLSVIGNITGNNAAFGGFRSQVLRNTASTRASNSFTLKGFTT